MIEYTVDHGETITVRCESFPVAEMNLDTFTLAELAAEIDEYERAGLENEWYEDETVGPEETFEAWLFRRYGVTLS